MIKSIREDPTIPIHWGLNKPGMQASEELPEILKENAEEIWLQACDNAIESAKALHQFGIHKQVANRLLEPFAHITVCVTATDWDNFFELRCHEDAEPNMQFLANLMQGMLNGSTPITSKTHLPYCTTDDIAQHNLDILQSISVARCARVSYKTHDNKPPRIEEDLKLTKRLYESKHWSPFEHIATIGSEKTYANFYGWKSLRYIFEHGDQLLNLRHSSF